MKAHPMFVLLAAAALASAVPAAAAAATTALDPEEAAAQWWAEQIDSGAVAFPEAVTVQTRRVTPWAAGTRVRLAQRLLGVPVDGHELILSFDPRGELRRVAGEPVSAVLLDPVPTLQAIDAMAVAAQHAELVWGRARVRPEAALRVVIGTNGRARLCWRLTVVPGPGAWHLFVDAHDGRFVSARPLFQTARGDVYRTNPVNGGPLQVELPGISGDLLEGPYTTVQSCIAFDPNLFDCEDFVAFAEADEVGDFFYPPDPAALEDPFAEVQLYYHLDLAASWFDEELGYEQAAPIRGVANVEFPNAFFGDLAGDGSYEVVFGQAKGVDLAYDADVVYHEFTHSVLVALIGLHSPTLIDEYGYDHAPGALAEGTADLFAMILTGDPLLAEYGAGAFGSDASALRDLEPDLRCPDDIYGEGHEDGKIWGSMGWNLVDDDRIGPDLTAQVIYGAMTSWSSATNWEAAGQSLVEAVLDMEGEGLMSAAQADAILEHGEASGVIGCGRVIRLDDGVRPTYTLVHFAIDEGFTSPLPLEFSLDAPPEATVVEFAIDQLFVAAGPLGWKIFMRRGEHVVFGVVQGPTYPHLEPVVYDDVVEGTGTYQYQLRLDSDRLLEPGATYYFAVTSWEPPNGEGFGVGLITLSGRVEDRVLRSLWDEDEGDGCSACGSSVGGGSTGPWLLAGPMLLAGRRRRRGRSTIR